MSTKTSSDEISRAVIMMVMFEQGILPIDDMDFDMKRILGNLTPEESRICRRRFRKLWRKILREKARGVTTTRAEAIQAALAKDIGAGERNPGRIKRKARKQLVFNHIHKTIIGPMLAQIKNPKATPEE